MSFSDSIREMFDTLDPSIEFHVDETLTGGGFYSKPFYKEQAIQTFKKILETSSE